MSIYKKLNEFKKAVGKVKKDANNPFHKSKYSTIESVLDTVEEPLSNVGLGFVQCVDDMFLETIIYDEESSDTIKSRVPLIISKQDMQQLGSAITYARRYALVSMFGLEQEDDDGNATLKEKPKYNNATASTPKEFISEIQGKSLVDYCKEHNSDLKEVMAFFKISRLGELSIKQYNFAMSKVKNGDFLK